MRGLVVLIVVFWDVFAFGQDFKLTLPISHTEQVSQVSISLDGLYALTSDQTNVKLWETKTGALLLDNNNRALSHGFSNNPNEFYLISEEEGIEYWDITEGEMTKSISLNVLPSSKIAFSENGLFLCIESLGIVSVWDLSNEKKICELETNISEILHVQVSNNGAYFLVHNRRELEVYDTNLKKIINHKLPKHDRGGHASRFLNSLFSPNSSKIVCSMSEEALLFEIENPKKIEFIDFNRNIRNSIPIEVMFINDEKLLGHCNSKYISIKSLLNDGNDTLIHVNNDDGFNLKRANFIYFIRKSDSGSIDIEQYGNTNNSFTLNPQNNEGVHYSILSNENKYLLTFINWEIRIKNMFNGKLITTVKLPFRNNYNIAYNRDFDVIEISRLKSTWSGEKREAVIFDVKTLSILEERDLTPTGNIDEYYTIGTHSVDIWNSTSHEIKKHIELPWPDSKIYKLYEQQLYRINALVSNKLGDQVLIKKVRWKSGKEQVILWDNKSMKSKFELPFENTNYIDLSFSENGKQAVMINRRQVYINSEWEVVIWNLESGEIDNKIKFESRPSVIKSTTEKRLIIKDLKGAVFIYNYESKELQKLKESYSAVFYWEKTNELYCAKNNLIYTYNIKSGAILKSNFSTTYVITQITQSEDGNLLVVSSNVGEQTIIDLDKNEVLFSFYEFSNPSDFITITPEGLFDASSSLLDYIHWVKGKEILSIGQIKSSFWSPNLWQDIISNKATLKLLNLNDLKLQPEINFGELNNGKLPIKLTKRNGGYGKLSIFINGKEVINDARGNDLDTSQIEQTILYSIKDHPYLINGENEIMVKASSADGYIQGRGDIYSAHVEKTTSIPQFFGVVIGVSDYANDKINLKYPVKDAEAMTTSLQMGAENLFGEDRTFIYSITSSVNKKPTKNNIKVIFDKISEKANPEDVIVIYLSGHGVTWGGDKGDFYFLTSDATASNKAAYGDPIIRENNTISTNEWVEWLKMIPALKQVMIIDACGSGMAVDNLIASRNIEASQIKAIDRMKDRTGMYIISGCTADAVSYEASQYGQGLLTYSILEAMQGAAIKSDGSVDVDLMMQHARERVPVLAKGVGGVQQPQLLVPKGGSFDIGVLSDDDQKAIPVSSYKQVFVRSVLVDKKKFKDVMGLSKMLNSELGLVSSKGPESKIVYFDTEEHSGACQISGGYSNVGDKIEASIIISCGEDEVSYVLNANSKEELIKNIIKLLEGLE